MMLQETKNSLYRGILIDPDPGSALNFRKIALGGSTLLECISSAAELDSYHASPEYETGIIILKNDNEPEAVPDIVRSILKQYPAALVFPVFPAHVSPAVQELSLRAGVSDFFIQPVTPLEFRFRLHRSLSIHTTSLRQQQQVSNYEDEVRRTIGEVLFREWETILVLGKAAENRDQETGAHILRVSHYSKLIAMLLGKTDAEQDTLFYAAALHDIGKIGIPDSILMKPGKLDREEYQIMQTHAEKGHLILEQSRSSYLVTGALIALTHHEKYDGTGYPIGLEGNGIPLYGRITEIADVFDALTTRRPYKEPWTLGDAFEYLNSERGKQFDPVLIDAFLYNEGRVREIYEQYGETPNKLLPPAT